MKEYSDNLFSSIRNFAFTYKQAVKIAWSVDKKTFLSVTIMSSLNGLLLLPSLIVTKKIVDAVMMGIVDKKVDEAIKLAIIFISINFLIDLAKNAFERFDWIFSDNLARRVSVAIQLQALEKINRLSVADAENPKIRDLFKKVFDLSSQRSWGLLMPVSFLPFLLFSIISASIPIFQFKAWIIIPAIILAFPEVFIASRYSKKDYELSNKLTPSWRIWSAYEEFCAKGRYVYENKILTHVDSLLTRIKKLADDNFGQRFALRYKFGKMRYLVNMPLGVINTSIRVFFYIQAIIGKISLGDAQMLFRSISELVGNLSSLGRQVNEIYENYLYVSDHNKFINLTSEDIQMGKTLEKPFTMGIEFNNVWFKYPQNNGWTLRGVTFKVDPTENLAIVGKNGAGKTTIIKLLCKFYTPQKGNILVNGVNIKDYQTEQYRKTISALFQDFAQYPFSAKENIGFGDYKKMEDEQKLRKTAKLVGIDEFIEKLPKTYENALDNEFEGGIEPSKGQWQRIALARALFRDASIYILDEPTSNVDPQAEEEIFDKILSLAKEKIVMLVSHRFSTVRKADKILVLDGGKTVEYGSHDELLKKGKVYAKLYQLQAKAYAK